MRNNATTDAISHRAPGHRANPSRAGVKAGVTSPFSLFGADLDGDGDLDVLSGQRCGTENENHGTQNPARVGTVVRSTCQQCPRYLATTRRRRRIRTTGAPSDSSYRPATVWTGAEMIVWGGAGAPITGGRYDPATDSWTPTSTVGVPGGRVGHSAVWTGTEMIVWGGEGGDTDYWNTGGRYDPACRSVTPRRR